MTDNLSNIAKIIVDDENFINNCVLKIKKLLKDGKIELNEIPEVVKIVMDNYNNLKKVKVTYNELPELLEEIIDYIFTTNNFLPDKEEEKVKDLKDG